MRKILGMIAGLCVMAGCQASADYTPNPSEETVLQVSDFTDRTVSFQQTPSRIAVLGNGELEMVYALGEEVVGRPTSKDPAIVTEAEDVSQVGTSHEVDLERLTYVQPDLVMANAPMNEKDIPVIEGLGAEVLLTSANGIEDIQDQLALLGEVLQKEENAQILIEEIDQKIADLQNSEPEEKPKVLLVYGAPGSNMAALPNSLAGDILEKAGGENVAAQFESLETFPQYAQLNSERIVEADPDYIFFMAHGDPASAQEGFIKEMEQHSAWSELSAVKHDHLSILPSELFGTNPGTRIIDSLDYMRAELEEAMSE
ncbi:ABC transporter substrate-binding protein [Alkalicoccobacillus murimartini]|uniref:Iron complex transport system substrate-binding protein n=1 Tax=Alkalicoccobacillus murimartini TaxID=171685 RepID=A0ABT9YIQ8_9BACI|nr:ABC transporter substrate-binding protein [Alkalicoccobacillus murimartini]MDQ0207739.1 iron complex transport system substrate-binding protein [Alkalicoccobacillus murimartini]